MEGSPKEDAEIEFNECHCLARFKDEIGILTETEVTDEDLKKVRTALLSDLERYGLVEFFTVILSKSEREKMRMSE
jgi:hypothetical protein